MLEPMPWARALLLVAVALFAPPGCTRDAPPAVAEVRIDELPVEARQTLEQIRRGGPYEYRKDGAVFGNREKRLPARPRGYYTEYTVKTPYSRDRGARRIVAGRGAERNPATSGEYYYTDDHYNSFRRIRE
jgi:ribonuclease T1